ncbi:SAM-dependent methyltransferase [Ammoniphilus sp. CFH 90114]|uniref:class I SAM-dependent methyltransferase n=1 Tax=Ammoniphilus sp. CFH 90114 TaxID=2493665 RepID=UPI00100E3A5B|nr:SAM-dependent methyltransferase [Ammoniphilus sp. CFH 90114]RXT08820.1 SAM-dependent methyltransferase [Ammoniphilus sp. CFH 90114]
MEKLQSLLAGIIPSRLLYQAVLSGVRKKEPDGIQKVTVKPVELKGQFFYQFSYYYEKKVLHDNLTVEETEQKLQELFSEVFKQGMIHTAEADYQVLISKKFKVTILKKPASIKQVELTHNRKKNYLLEEGTPIPFLVELGVMNPEGKVLAKKYDKFRQINRFLEMIRDIVPHLNKDRKLTILDFGCGKSYLTFAMYHYLREVEGLDFQVVGLDLKEDVICHCNELVEKLQYKDLRFLVGDIAKYTEVDHVDMVVTLHACDTATDAALEKAVRWGADVILSVPCCQHEMFTQVENEVLDPMLKHGIIKERFSALATDSVRATLLELMGYRTQILEFIDLEHTPKNLLIRAVKGKQTNVDQIAESYLEFKRFLQVTPYLEKALEDKLEPILAGMKK